MKTFEIKDSHGVTWNQFATDLFEFEYCHECYGDAEDHIPCLGIFGGWFAMCKFSPFTSDYALRNGKLQNIGEEL